MSDLDTRLLRFRNLRGEEAAPQLATDLLAAERSEEALEVIATAAERGDARLPLALLEGRVWMQRGDLLRAQAVLIQAAQLAVDDPEPFEALGEVLLKRQDPQRALAVLQRALQLGSRKPSTLAAYEAARAGAAKDGKVAETPAPLRPPAVRKLRATLRFDAAAPLDAPAPLDAAAPTLETSPPFEGVSRAQRDAITTTLTEMAAESQEMTGTWARPELSGLGQAGYPPVPAKRAESLEQAAAPGKGEPTPSQEVLPADPSVDFVVAVPEAAAAAPPSPKPARSRAATQPPPTPPAKVRLPPPPSRASLPTLPLHQVESSRPSPPGVQRKAPYRTVMWGLGALVLAGGLGFGGLRAWRWLKRPEQAAKLMRSAEALVLWEDAAAWPQAERLLRQAAATEPRNAHIGLLRWRVRAQRWLEEGRFDVAPVVAETQRPAMPAKGDATKQLLRALQASAADDVASLAPLLRNMANGGRGDGWALGLAGRLAQRAEMEEATAWLRQAQTHDLSAPLALAEAAADAGDWPEAMRWVEAALRRKPASVRGRLWRGYVAAHGSEAASNAKADEALKALRGLQGEVGKAAASGECLYHLAEAHLLHRSERRSDTDLALQRARDAAVGDAPWSARLAREALTLGRSALAEQAARRALRFLPKRPSLQLLLSRILLQRGAAALALASLPPATAWQGDMLRHAAQASLELASPAALRELGKRLNAANPGGVSAEKVRAWRLLLQLKATPETPGLLEQSLALAEKAPASFASLFAHSEVAWQRGSTTQARQAAEQLQRLAPKHPEGDLAMARVAARAGNYAEASVALRLAMAKAPSDARPKLAMGTLLATQGLHESALQWFEQVRRDEAVTKDGEGWLQMQLARLHSLMELRRFADAEAVLQSLGAERRDAPAGRTMFAELALARGKAEVATEQLQALVQSGKADALALATYGRALLAQGKAEPAGGNLSRALEKDPELMAGLLGMAEYFVGNDEPPAALSMLERAQRVCRRRGCSSSVQAQILLSTGKAHLRRRRKYRPLALETLRQATEMQGSPAEAWFVYGRALTEDKPAQGQLALRHYLELDPDGVHAAQARKLLAK